MKELPGIGFYDQVVDPSFGYEQQAMSVMGALVHPPVYGMLNENGQKLAQAASRALSVADADDRFAENASFGREHAGNFPLTHKFLESAIAHAVELKSGVFDFDAGEADRLLINGMNAQNDAMSLLRISDQYFSSDFDVLANGHMSADITDQKDYDAKLAAAKHVSIGNLSLIEHEQLDSPLKPAVEEYVAAARQAVTANPVDMSDWNELHAHTLLVTKNANIQPPANNEANLVADTFSRAGKGETLTSLEMRGLGYNDYVISQTTETPGIENDTAHRGEVAAIGKAYNIVKEIAHGTSAAYERMGDMGMDIPQPSNEPARALLTVLPQLQTDVENNAHILLTATESQYAAKFMMDVITTIRDCSPNSEVVMAMNAHSPGIKKTVDYALMDDRVMAETTRLMTSDIQALDPVERLHYNQGIEMRSGITTEQKKLVSDMVEGRTPIGNNLAHQIAAGQAAQMAR